MIRPSPIIDELSIGHLHFARGFPSCIAGKIQGDYVPVTSGRLFLPLTSVGKWVTLCTLIFGSTHTWSLFLESGVFLGASALFFETSVGRIATCKLSDNISRAEDLVWQDSL